MVRAMRETSWTCRLRLVMSSFLYNFPFGEVWDEYCKACGAPVGMDWIEVVDQYESEVLSKR